MAHTLGRPVLGERWGRSAAQEDIVALHQAFKTMLFPPRDRHPVNHEDPFAFIHSLGATNGRPDEVQEGRTPRVALDSVMYGEDTLTFVAYLEPEGVLSVGVESNSYWTTASSPRTGSDKEHPVQASLSVIGKDAALLDGVISPEVSRVRIFTQSGDAEPRLEYVRMRIVQLPKSLGTTDRYVWALVGDRSTMREIAGYDDSGDEGRGAYVVGYDSNGDLIPE